MKCLLLFIFLFVVIISHAQELIPYHGKDGWGYADTSGKILVEPNRYCVNQPPWPEESKKIILRDGKVVYVDGKGKQVQRMVIEKPYFQNVYNQKENKWQSIFHSPWNKTNDSIYDYLDNVQSAKSGYFVVGRMYRCGLIDSTGKLIIPIEHHRIEAWGDFIYADSAYYYQAIYSYSGKEIIPSIYKSIEFNYDVGFFICDTNRQYEIVRGYSCLTDFRDSLGNLIFSIKGTYLGNYSSNFIVSDSDSIRLYSKNGKWLFSLDTTGKFLENITSDYIQFGKYKNTIWDEPRVAFELYSLDGKFIRRDSTQQEIFLKNGSVLIRKDNHQVFYPQLFPNNIHYDLIDSTGNKIEEIEADSIMEYSWAGCGLVSSGLRTLLFAHNGKFGWICEYDGHIMVPAQYDLKILTRNPSDPGQLTISYSKIISKENFIAGDISGAYLLDSNGFVLAGPFADMYYENNVIFVLENDSILFLDKHGNEIGKVKGDYLISLQGIADFMEVGDGNGIGLLRISDLKLIVPCIANYISPVHDLFFVEVYREKDGQNYFWLDWYIDKNGRNYIDQELLNEIPR